MALIIRSLKNTVHIIQLNQSDKVYYVQIGLFPPTPTYPRMSEQLKEKYQFH